MKFGTAAANRDREIGELIAKAFEKGWGNDLQFLAVSSFLNSSSSLLSICCACEPAFTFQFLPFCLLSFFFLTDLPCSISSCSILGLISLSFMKMNIFSATYRGHVVYLWS